MTPAVTLLFSPRKRSADLALSVGVAGGVAMGVVSLAAATVLIPFCIMKCRRDRLQGVSLKK